MEKEEKSKPNIKELAIEWRVRNTEKYRNYL